MLNSKFFTVKPNCDVVVEEALLERLQLLVPYIPDVRVRVKDQYDYYESIPLVPLYEEVVLTLEAALEEGKKFLS